MRRQPTDAVARLGGLLSERLGSTRRLSLYEAFVANDESFEPDTGLVAHLVGHRAELASWMGAASGDRRGGGGWERSPATVLRGLLVPWLYEKNQFFRVDAEGARRLEALYRRAMLDVARVLSSPVSDARAAEELRRVWRAHRARLASFARERLGEEPRDAVCACYSPSLQLAVLGLAAGPVAGPVLDVGCGWDATLVRRLRLACVEAHGIDRVAPEEVDGVLAVDWLDFDYGDGVWGTVVSHLGLSLHFLRHHLANGPAAESLALAHAGAYARVLRSLRVGGSFAYVPALPFVEALLPDRGSPAYRHERIVPPEGLSTPALRTFREDTGLDLAPASRVLRTA